MSYEDKHLKCKICGCDFVWTASEQEFYASKSLVNEPVRCYDCRVIKKQEKKANKNYTKVVCAECGRETVVPFNPSGTKPVYCRECFKLKKEN